MDRGALFIGTPKGRNHFYSLFQAAHEREGWTPFQFTTEQGGIVSLEELEAARHELDERIFRQEFQASFENLGVGLAYYGFDRAHNVRPLRYNPKLPLFWSLDFNVNPMCSVIGQSINGYIRVLDELVVANSNTHEACEEFLERTKDWLTTPDLPGLPPGPATEALLMTLKPTPLNVYIYGDATGESRRSSASRTDWQIVRNFFGRYPDKFHAHFRVPSANPPVKDRINCVNAMVRNHAGECRLLIDPTCKELTKDLEQVSWKADSHGNPLPDLDKSDSMRTHVSDALGYWLAHDFPMRARRGVKGGVKLDHWGRKKVDHSLGS